MTDDLPPFPDRRSFMVGPVGTSAYIQACATYTAIMARKTFELESAVLEEMRALNRNLEGLMTAPAGG